MNLNDDSIMAKVILPMEILTAIETSSLSDIGRCFNLPATIIDREHLLKQLKNVFSRLLLIERSNYNEYLQLPKFKKISKENQQAILNVFHQIWSAFEKEVQTQTNTIKFNNYYQPMNYYGFQKPNMFYDNVYQQQLHNQGNFGLPHSNQFGFPQSIYHQMFVNYPMPHPFQQNREENVLPPEEQLTNKLLVTEIKAKSNERPRKYPKTQNFDSKYEVQRSPPIQTKKTQVLLPQILTKYKQPILDTICLEFILCPCSGKKYRNEQFFECIKCKYFYHLICLQVTQKPLNSHCPYCIHEKKQRFTKVICQTIKKDYYSIRDNDIKIQFIEDELNIFENCLNYIEQKKKKLLRGQPYFELDLVKVSSLEKSAMIEETQIQSKTNHTRIQIDAEKAKSIFLNKFLTIKNQENQKQMDKALVFYTFSCYELMTIDQQINIVLKGKKVTETYLQAFADADENGFVIVDLLNRISHQHIEIPVRGQRCKHADVFDLRFYLEEQQRTKICPICEISLDTENIFILDTFLFDVINTQVRDLPEDRRPKELQYYKNGEWRVSSNFQEEEPSQSSSSPQSENKPSQSQNQQNSNQMQSESEQIKPK